jgi:hypothetical protein
MRVPIDTLTAAIDVSAGFMPGQFISIIAFVSLDIDFLAVSVGKGTGFNDR